jgi:GMP synthase (glutamine-hydrolysing)
VDNGSIYTKNLANYISEQAVDFSTVKFNEASSLEISRFDSFILSGRIKNNKKMNAINSQIIKHVISEKKSLLGICYGAEILAITMGGTIKKSNKPVKGEETVLVEKENEICQKEARVFESHKYEISQLGNQLHSLASSKSCKHEIVKHNDLDIFGTQFHPEMSRDGQSVIKAFLSI